MESKKIVWKYGVKTVGIKNRCRKTEWHYIDKLGESDEYNVQRCKELAEIALADKMKSYDRSKTFATATLWTVDNGMERWAPFTKEHNITLRLDG